MPADCVDQPGRDQVHCDAALGEFVRERLGEAVEAGLGRYDMRTVRGTGIGGEAADIDDRARLAPGEVRQDGPAAEERPVERDADHLPPFREASAPRHGLLAGARHC